jgi:hypothetical protein
VHARLEGRLRAACRGVLHYKSREKRERKRDLGHSIVLTVAKAM